MRYFYSDGLEESFFYAPLLFSTPHAVLIRGLTSAIAVGPGKIRGTAYEYLAFRFPGLDLIENGGFSRGSTICGTGSNNRCGEIVLDISAIPHSIRTSHPVLLREDF